MQPEPVLRSGDPPLSVLYSSVLAQIPPPRKHLVRYHGFYSNAARGKRRQAVTGQATIEADCAHHPEETAPARAARKRWADLLRHVYEVDPLVCPAYPFPANRGAGPMIPLDHHASPRILVPS